MSERSMVTIQKALCTLHDPIARIVCKKACTRCIHAVEFYEMK
jgi:hypothetical protein